jgi:hypothetical protein
MPEFHVDTDVQRESHEKPLIVHVQTTLFNSFRDWIVLLNSQEEMKRFAKIFRRGTFFSKYFKNFGEEEKPFGQVRELPRTARIKYRRIA